MKSFKTWKNLREGNRAASALGGQRNYDIVMDKTKRTNRPGNAQGSGEAVEQIIKTVLIGNDPASQKAVLKKLRYLITKFPDIIKAEVEAEEKAGNPAGNVR